MARQSPNSNFIGQSVMADVPGAPDLIQMFQQAVGQAPVYDPEAEAIQMALAERDRIMAERGQSAPTYLPQGQTQGSLASVPHTAGYAGPTRASDLLFPMAQTPIMRPAAEQVLRGQPLEGQPGKTLGNVADLAAASRGIQGREAQAALVEGAFPGLLERGMGAVRRGAGDTVLDRQKAMMLERRMNDIGDYYSKNDGSPMAKSFEGDNLPTNEDFNKNFVKLDPPQKAILGSIRMLDDQIAQYKRIINALDLPGTPGAVKRGINSVNQWRKWAQGQPEWAELEALQAEIMVQARILGQNSKTMDSNLERSRMERAIPSAFNNKAANDAVIRRMERIRDLGTNELPIKNPLKGSKPQQQRTTGVSKSGRPIFSDDGGRTWHYGE